MRKDIHPTYQQVLFHDTNADAYFLIGSTLQTKQTKEYQGKVYPYVTLDISSASKVVLQALINALVVLTARVNLILSFTH